jgi:hypothetical protein
MFLSLSENSCGASSDDWAAGKSGKNPGWGVDLGHSVAIIALAAVVIHSGNRFDRPA